MFDGTTNTAEAGGSGEEKCATASGDTNGDGNVNISDASFLLGYLFLGGDAPVPLCVDPSDLEAVEEELALAKVALAACRAGANGPSLPDTGQTICIGIVVDEDGNEEWPAVPCEGAACPGQDGFYATGCPSEARFVDNEDGTVTDTCTGLMWQKFTGNGGNRNRLPQCNALAYCEGLEFAGHNDWRLPNVRELLSIVDYGRRGLAIVPVFDEVPPDGPDAPYWSSTFLDRGLGSSWTVEFVDGDLKTGRGTALVRAVRTAP